MALSDRQGGARYVELNPVRAGLVKKPEAWRWSSAAAHTQRKDDMLGKTEAKLRIVNSPWKKFLSADARESEMTLFRKHERTGRPMGDDAFGERSPFIPRLNQASFQHTCNVTPTAASRRWGRGVAAGSLGRVIRNADIGKGHHIVTGAVLYFIRAQIPVHIACIS